jgi:hypothetical protein
MNELPKAERALVAALVYAKHDDDSNPDVGMGPSLDSLLDRVLARAEIDKHMVDAEAIVREAALILGRRK